MDIIHPCGAACVSDYMDFERFFIALLTEIGVCTVFSAALMLNHIRRHIAEHGGHVLEVSDDTAMMVIRINNGLNNDFSRHQLNDSSCTTM